MPTPTPTQTVFTDFSSLGTTEEVFSSLLILTATGGTGGTYVPTQYYNTNGTESATGAFLFIPEGFGVTARLTWVDSIPGFSFVEGSYIYVQENGVTVASTSFVGIYEGPIEVTFPNPIVAGIDYQIVSFLAGTGGTAVYWNTLAQPWNISTVIWNE